jgi:hypothetical protein
MTQNIDPSLARGLARSLVRETQADVDTRLARVFTRLTAADVPKGRAARYRMILNQYRTFMRAGLIVDRAIGTGIGKKSDQHIFASWDTSASSPVVVLAVCLMRARDFSMVPRALLIVTQHATERLFQRLHTTDPKAVRAELQGVDRLVAAVSLGLPFLAPLVPALLMDGLLVPTRSGALSTIYSPEDGTLVATTWLSNDQLGARQLEVTHALRQWPVTLTPPLTIAQEPLPLSQDPYAELPDWLPMAPGAVTRAMWTE